MFILYWSACAIYIVTGVLRVQVYALISSPPADLYPQHYKEFGHEDYDELARNGFRAERTPISVIRRIRLANLHETAEELIEVNGRVRKQLSRARIAVIIAPVCALSIAVMGYLFS